MSPQKEYPELTGEDWRWESVKDRSDKKLANASHLVGLCMESPTEETLKIAIGAVSDFLIHVPAAGKNKDKRDGYLNDLRDLQRIIFGRPDNPEIKQLLEEYKISYRKVRRGSRVVKKIDNVPDLAYKLLEIMKDAADFSTASGNRIMLHRGRLHGMKKILDEENLDADDLKRL